MRNIGRFLGSLLGGTVAFIIWFFIFFFDTNVVLAYQELIGSIILALGGLAVLAAARIQAKSHEDLATKEYNRKARALLRVILNQTIIFIADLENFARRVNTLAKYGNPDEAAALIKKRPAVKIPSIYRPSYNDRSFVDDVEIASFLEFSASAIEALNHNVEVVRAEIDKFDGQMTDEMRKMIVDGYVEWSVQSLTYLSGLKNACERKLNSLPEVRA